MCLVGPDIFFVPMDGFFWGGGDESLELSCMFSHNYWLACAACAFLLSVIHSMFWKCNGSEGFCGLFDSNESPARRVWLEFVGNT